MSRAFKPGPALGPKLMGPLERAMAQGGDWLVKKVRQSINTGNRDGSNPSKPFDPPHKVTARLYKSIARVVDVGPAEIVVRVGTNVRYGRFLELGTGRMAPRPFLRPALLKHRVDFAKVVARALRQLTR